MLSLSGGGFRAAAFHLGTLDLLFRTGLLGDVTMLSTVSGGTFTGAGYALAQARGEAFPDFFRRFRAFLRQNTVLQGAVRQFAADPAGGANLITAAARSYQEFFNAQFAELLDAATHLKEIVFNATEFSTGLYFRFQKSQSPDALFGNKNFPVPPDVARQVHLADVVAASSCFPGGFEPLGFPDDFRWPAGLEKVRARLGDKFPLALPLMDGGIFDNQGISSLLLAGKRPGGTIGLFLVSDTDRPSTAIFRFPPARRRGWLTLRNAAALGWGLFALACAAAGGLIWDAAVSVSQRGLHPLEDLFVHVLPTGLALAVALGVLAGNWWVQKELVPLVPDLGIDLWETLRELPAARAVDLADVRIRSLYALASDVFMKRIRLLQYKMIHEHPKYRDRIMETLIYDLAPGNKWAKMPKGRRWLVPSAGVQAVADRARQMPTTLWFSAAGELPDLVACGQATTCWNLLRRIVKTHGEEPNAYPSAVRQVFDEARRLWDVLQQDPHALVNGP